MDRKNASEPLLGIGDFSRYAGLSVRMLRHYDQRGLLPPAEVDRSSGYRRYSPDQLRVAGRIRDLRDAGCGITLIAELLPLFADPETLRARLDAHVASLDRTVADLAVQRRLALALADSVLAAPRRVGERTVPGARVLLLRRTVSSYPAEHELWADFSDFLNTPGAVDADRLGATVGSTYYDEEYRDDDVEMAVWREYDGPLGRGNGFSVADLPPQRVAWTTHRGPYEGIESALEEVGRWIAHRGLRRVGPPFNLYVVGPGRQLDPSKWMTEVNIPIG
ncbi:DNA-binding transcriptional MerR regulator [Microbacterium sp. SORGH_AS 1204]|uniref:MerR family transcriptional regulator n=1 Tax=Microbacterium sp. SORGH_AS_1204 TaxID=3041785 RepID=UPI002794FA8C|nr:MerR family transcriptional regulator [Microbacterium sp. SORGH_AS_1204]MDQ1136612.1 DNA-binding transcriptional MerR regulator [Microbacterium sp. SORGH_AS_1204]